MSSPATYDVIVVGAGSAGCVVAARLSENPAIRIPLLEAGGTDEDVLEAAAWPAPTAHDQNGAPGTR